jgi:uncharacterized protein
MTDDLDLRGFRNVTRLFPLPGVVLFPHVVLPLHIFEPRYREMTREALEGDRLITIVQTRSDADWTGHGEPAIEEIGCLGKIIRHEQLADGRYNFLLLGKRRVRLIREREGPSLFRTAEVELIDEIEPGPDDPRRKDLIRLFREAVRVDPDLERVLGQSLPLTVLTDLMAHSLGLPPVWKQTLLAQPDARLRADSLIDVLARILDAADPGRPPRPFPPFSVN